jgi:formimidoylglutamate deiminase
MPETMLWAPRAWAGGTWRSGVVLTIGTDGHWARIEPDVAQPPAGATVLAGPALPGLVDAHSHAFQRTFAGLAERREAAADDFWSWRDRMYQVALRIAPAQLRAVATHLYVELLRGGYTHVVEFHYLHHERDGTPYRDDPLAMSWALVGAAADAGIGLTLLPVLYERAGFTAPALRDDQRRFATDADGVWHSALRIRAARQRLVDAGIAIHSLRAAAPASIRHLRGLAEGFDGPIHIHVAEQAAEVDACLAATGARPIEWLAREALLDARWQLVHATHALPAEIDAVARAGAGVVVCPSTEANLGDGLPDLPRWLAAGTVGAAREFGVPISIGSDSHVTRAWREELRWLDYGQRLVQRRRNVAAAPERGLPATAAHLFERALHGSAAAIATPRWGLVAGARADALVVDVKDASLLGVPPDHLLDALVFSSPGRPWHDVMVAGRWVVREHRHDAAAPAAAAFEQAMAGLCGTDRA